MSKEKNLSKSMMIIVLWTGLLGIAVQFNDSVKNLAIWLGVLNVFCLAITSQRYFDEREQQLLHQSFSSAFQWLAVLLLVTFGILQASESLGIIENVALFINSHWIGLAVSLMAAMLGMIGLRALR